MKSKKAFTLIELLVVVSIIALLIAILLPALGVARKTARKMTNSTQQRGIHQGLVNFAQGNKTPTGDGFYPGLSNKGALQLMVNFSGADGSYDTDGVKGSEVSTRFTVMLNKGFFTPEYLINPIDSGADLNRDGTAGSQYGPVTPVGTATVGADLLVGSDNYSYCLLQIESDTTDTDRRREWSETINSQATVVSDRNVGTAAAAESVWTDIGTEEWEGTTVRNDGSALFVSYVDAAGDKKPIAENSRYNQKETVAEDNLFLAADGGTSSPNANAAMVYEETDLESHDGVDN